MNSSRIYFTLALLLNANFSIAQEQAETINNDKALIEEAIKIEASSANAAAKRQSYINDIDTDIIILIGDIQFFRKAR